MSHFGEPLALDAPSRGFLSSFIVLVAVMAAHSLPAQDTTALTPFPTLDKLIDIDGDKFGEEYHDIVKRHQGFRVWRCNDGVLGALAAIQRDIVVDIRSWEQMVSANALCRFLARGAPTTLGLTGPLCRAFYTIAADCVPSSVSTLIVNDADAWKAVGACHSVFVGSEAIALFQYDMTADSVQVLRKFKHVRALRLGALQSDLSDSALRAIVSAVPDLKYLKVAPNPSVTLDFLETALAMPDLEVLDLTGCPLENGSVRVGDEVNKLTVLRSVSVSWCCEGAQSTLAGILPKLPRLTVVEVDGWRASYVLAIVRGIALDGLRWRRGVWDVDAPPPEEWLKAGAEPTITGIDVVGTRLSFELVLKLSSLKTRKIAADLGSDESLLSLGLSRIVSLRDLQLNLSGQNATFELASLTAAERLIRLEVRGANAITYDGVSALPFVKSLVKLDLGGCPQGDLCALSTYEWPLLEYLNLDRWNLDREAFLELMENAPRIRVLGLYNTSMRPAGDTPPWHASLLQALEEVNFTRAKWADEDVLLALSQGHNALLRVRRPHSSIGITAARVSFADRPWVQIQ